MINKQFVFLIVIYNIKANESSTLMSLNSIFNKANNLLNVLVFDNSTNDFFKIDEARLIYSNLKIEYIKDTRNPGLSVAYNKAISLHSDKEFIAIFDQDTTITEEYFTSLFLVLENRKKYIAFVPEVISKNKILISPSKIVLGSIVLDYKSNTKLNYFISAINSGAIFNINYIKSSGGFSEKFHLDMLDHYTFRKINRDLKSIYVLPSTIYQDLSIENYSKNVSIQRYISILKSELIYIKDSNLIEILIYKFRLVLRTFKFIIKLEFDFCYLNFKYIFKYV